MTKVDLITGFLGSGKTTFLRRYARYLMEKGEKIGIIENDFGAVNVDMLLLQDLEENGASTEMVAGGTDIATYRRRFKTKLIALGMQGFDRVLIEPSGVFDAEEFFDVLYDDPLSRWYEIGSVIAVVDAQLEEDLSEEADYLLVSQLADAGCVVLSRTQCASEEEIGRTIRHIHRAMEHFSCRRTFGENEFLAKNWDDLTDDDFEHLKNCGFQTADHTKLAAGGEEGFGSLSFMNLSLSVEQMKAAAQQLLHDETCGQVYRVKGFVPQGEEWLEINANRDGISEERLKAGQNVVILVGEHMQEPRIREILGIDTV